MDIRFLGLWLFSLASFGYMAAAQAQPIPEPPRDIFQPRPGQQELPDILNPAQPLPPPEELLNAPIEPSDNSPSIDPTRPDRVRIEKCIVLGSTVFSVADFAPITEACKGQDLSFNELLEIRSKITQLYIDEGYQTSGAFIPPQVLEAGVVEIQVVEGRLEAIRITGNQRLKQHYIRQRILAKVGNKPLNVNQLLKALQLLQLDPLLETINAELLAGTRPGTSLLDIKVVEARSLHLDISLNNGRSPSVGSFERELQFRQGNLLGIGDGVSLTYGNTTGSHKIGIGYEIPVNGDNGTISAGFSQVWSRVLNSVTNNDAVQFAGNSRVLSLGFRQPIVRTPNQEIGLGIELARRESETILRFRDDIPIDDLVLDQIGITEIKFTQDWLKRWQSSVFALRSEFGLGVDVSAEQLATNFEADNNFFAWRGQAQWVKRLGRDSLFLSRSNLQLSDRALFPIEQFGIGGLDSVRGYRQDLQLIDNGIFASAEARIPIFRGFGQGVLQLVPFIDAAHGWDNQSETNALNPPQSSTLATLGLGIRWQWSDRLSAQFNWGVPLLRVNGQNANDPLADSGIDASRFFFSITASPY